MKKIGLLIATAALISFVGCKENKKDAIVVVEKVVSDVKKTPQKSVSFRLESKNESNTTGKAQFVELDGSVSFYMEVMGLNPGVHAVHIHEKADCSSPDGKSAGGHWNPTLSKHGKWGNAEGFHRGDIGNLTADKNGNGRISLKTNEWCIGCDDDKMNVIGKGIIVHQGADDYVTQPTGAAGGRISCGGIIQ
jgi:Cu-Zn family superoxide dismutase|tara:strand:+ start:37 stop:612 length:576 start_codon:yes stop_codon:yes gene_type:complete